MWLVPAGHTGWMLKDMMRRSNVRTARTSSLQKFLHMHARLRLLASQLDGDK
jgi:hypothetical protein